MMHHWIYFGASNKWDSAKDMPEIDYKIHAYNYTYNKKKKETQLQVIIKL